MRTMVRRADWLGMITVFGVVVAASGQAAPAPPTQPADPRVDQILTRLAERQVNDLKGDVLWKTVAVLGGEEDALRKRGELWYQDTEPVARFMIHFTGRISGTGRKDRLDEQYMFDGMWYVELKAQTKTVIRREVRKADDLRDPYKIGEGPFPLPFGQKKDDLLREFEIEYVEPADGDPRETDHLKLRPRRGTKTAERYKVLDFWVRQSGDLGGLPVMVQVTKLDGTGRVDSYVTVRFSDIKLNAGVADSVFEIRTPPGFHEEIERLEPAAVPDEGVESSGS